MAWAVDGACGACFWEVVGCWMVGAGQGGMAAVHRVSRFQIYYIYLPFHSWPAMVRTVLIEEFLRSYRWLLMPGRNRWPRLLETGCSPGRPIFPCADP